MLGDGLLIRETISKREGCLGFQSRKELSEFTCCSVI